MTGLLVSVRSREEASRALEGGADVIDIKEPMRGALGAADPEVWEQVQDVVGTRAIVTAALGELLSEGILERARETHGLKLTKIGLAGCHTEQGWLNRWFDVINVLPANVNVVPVAYADWHAANAPSPSVALALASQSPARLLLIDTHDKSRGGLQSHLPLESLTELSQLASAARVQLALAGSLERNSIRQLLALSPAYIGVRGAACRGGRSGAIEMELVKSLAQLVRGSWHKAAG